jgi:hypothetical protein
MEAICCSETSVDIQWTTRQYFSSSLNASTFYSTKRSVKLYRDVGQKSVNLYSNRLYKNYAYFQDAFFVIFHTSALWCLLNLFTDPTEFCKDGLRADMILNKHWEGKYIQNFSHWKGHLEILGVIGGLEDVDWIQLSQNGVQWSGLVTCNGASVSVKDREFPTASKNSWR